MVKKKFMKKADAIMKSKSDSKMEKADKKNDPSMSAMRKKRYGK